ncbi:MAG: UDP-galactopyranose mutase [Treponema sp.]|jgi:UDP-galactopyranose mutase|nr:UDP-galactopyranose mutase [Treponema sp.]
MNTFNKMRGVKTPAGAMSVIKRRRAEAGAVSRRTRHIREAHKRARRKAVARGLYGASRLHHQAASFALYYDNNYFNDRYQGVPQGGYTPIVEKPLSGGEVLNADYVEFSKKNGAEKTAYTGAIDAFRLSLWGA